MRKFDDKDQVDFYRNDLVYGRDIAREEYQKKFSTTWHRHCVAVVDDYNNFAFARTVSFTTRKSAKNEIVKMQAKAHTNAKRSMDKLNGLEPLRDDGSDWAKKFDVWMDGLRSTAIMTREYTVQARYSEALNNSRFAPLRVFEKNKEASVAKEGASNLAIEERRKNLAIRGACKFGIGFVSQVLQDQQQGGAKIHFLLDCLDMPDVLAKKPFSRPKEQTEDAKVPVTTSELLYVYRNWPELNRRQVIHFYLNGQELPAPWERGYNEIDIMGDRRVNKADDWFSYAIHRIVKYNGNVPEKTLI